MNSHQIIELNNVLNSIISRNEYILRFLSICYKHAKLLLPKLVLISNAEVGKQASAFREEIKDYKKREVFLATDRLHNEIRDYCKAISPKPLLFKEDVAEQQPYFDLLFLIHHFTQCYSEFVDYTSNDTIVNTLILSGSKLYWALEASKNQWSIIKEQLERSYIDEKSMPQENLKVITLVLDCQVTYQEFIDKLNAVARMYSLYCAILDIDEAQYPLQIVKIETGSIFQLLKGNKGAIEAIVELLKTVGTYVHKELLTKQGKQERGIEELKSKKLAFEIGKEIREALKQNGKSTDNIDEKLGKVADILMDDVLTYVEGGKSVKADGDIIELGISKGLNATAHFQKQIETKERLGLPPAPKEIEEKLELNEVSNKNTNPEDETRPKKEEEEEEDGDNDQDNSDEKTNEDEQKTQEDESE